MHGTKLIKGMEKFNFDSKIVTFTKERRGMLFKLAVLCGKMKKIQVILTLTFAFSMTGQISGVQFAPDRTHWSGATAFRTGTSTMFYVSNNVYLRGDTIINSKYYQKVFTSTSFSINALSSEVFDTTCLQFHGYIYYDGKKCIRIQR